MPSNTSPYYQAALDTLQQSAEGGIKRHHIDFTEYDESAKSHTALNLMGIRRTLDMSQSAFSSLLGISRSQYRKYEMGEEVIRMDIGHRISMKCGIPVFLLLRNSKYEELLDLPKKCDAFDYLWFFANSLTDEYFSKYCYVLAEFLGKRKYEAIYTTSNVSADDFVRAQEENENTLYIAIAEGIRAVRNYSHCSQEDVAGLMGVSASTYQEYEKATQRPRFNMLMAVRWTISTSVHPFTPLAGTYIVKIRLMQNERLAELQRLFKGVTAAELEQLKPLAEGFFRAAKSKQNSLFFNLV